MTLTSVTALKGPPFRDTSTFLSVRLETLVVTFVLIVTFENVICSCPLLKRVDEVLVELLGRRADDRELIEVSVRPLERERLAVGAVPA